MAASHIPARALDFLRQHPPYQFLPAGELENFAKGVEVAFFASGAILFTAGEAAGDFAYILFKGQVSLSRAEETGDVVFDICDTGDTFGVRPLLSGNPYLTTARATEDSLVYLIPKERFLGLIEAHPRVSLFFAAGFAAGMTIVREDSGSARKVLLPGPVSRQIFHAEEAIPLQPHSKVQVCSPGDSIGAAAAIMTTHRIGSLVVVEENRFPVGIITQTDFTRKLGTGQVNREDPVSALLSAPVITAAAHISLGRVILLMMRHRIRHLVFTEDGTPHTPLTGILSERDILLAQGNNPAVLVKQLTQATHPDELTQVRDRAAALIHSYLEQDIAIGFIAETITEINDALIERALYFAQEQLIATGKGPPPVDFTWLSLGSEGRREQLLRTDQDNALIFADAGPGQESVNKRYFLELAALVNQLLIQSGFAECAGGIMAANPLWCLSLSQWKKQFSKWIHEPDPGSLMNGTIFFDFRPVPESHPLALELSAHLVSETEETPIFLQFFAQNALRNPPPLSFFRNLILERSGNHKNEFDIKLRGMMPLTDIARLLILSHKVSGITPTVARFEKLATLEHHNEPLFHEAAMAYEILMRFRALEGFRNQNNGRYIQPESLNKIERQTLKSAFRTIESLQSIVRTRFSLSLFGS